MSSWSTLSPNGSKSRTDVVRDYPPRFASAQPLVKKGETNDSWRRPIIHSARLIVHRASW